MKGQAVARILLVIALIVTAHTIRPFSMKNLASHILFSTRSFAVVLPDSTRSSFDYANTLAVALSQSMFVDGSGIPTSAIPQNNLMAMAKAAPILEPQLEPQEVVAVKPMIQHRPMTKAESPRLIAVKRVKPVVKSTWAEAPAGNDIAEVNNNEDLAAISDSLDDSTPAEEPILADSTPADEATEAQPASALPTQGFSALASTNPVALPVNQFNVNCALNKIRPIQLNLPRVEIVRAQSTLISAWAQIKKSDCDGKREVSHIRLIAVIEPPRKPKSEKSVNLIEDCEDEGKSEATEAEVAGPQDEASELEESTMKIAPLVPTNPANPESCATQK